MSDRKSLLLMRKLKIIEDLCRVRDKPLLAKDIADAHEMLSDLYEALSDAREQTMSEFGDLNPHHPDVPGWIVDADFVLSRAKGEA